MNSCLNYTITEMGEKGHSFVVKADNGTTISESQTDFSKASAAF